MFTLFRKKTPPVFYYILLCTFVYFVNYLTRYNFSAALINMVSALDTEKTVLSIAVTVSSITYGAGQVVAGALGDHFPPRVFVAVGLLGTSLCNLFVGFSSSVVLIIVLWGANGLFQSIVWPSLVRYMVENFSERDYRRAAVWVSCGCNASTVFVYLALVPVCLSAFTWREAFYIPAIVGVLTVLLWLASGTPEKKEETKAQDEKPATETAQNRMPFGRLMILSGSFYIIVILALQGLLRDGVNTWMPTLVKDTYGLGEVAAVMSTAILPLFSILVVALVGKMLDRIGNEQTACLILWGVCLLSSGAMFLATKFFHGGNAVLGVALLALLFGSIHGINHLLTARVPRHFEGSGKVSTVAGVLNAGTYVGAAASGYGFAVISERFGWGATILVWCAASALALLLTLVSLRRYTAFIRRKTEETVA